MNSNLRMSKVPTSTRRLHKELSELLNNPVEGITVDSEQISSDIYNWRISVTGADGTLYSGEQFELKFSFTDNYPFDSPQVVFVGSHIPIHPHIYTNGHICLSILTEDWTPAMSVSSVCLSILSMLSSCKQKMLPPDNQSYVRTAAKNPKKTRWWFHDDKV